MSTKTRKVIKGLYQYLKDGCYYARPMNEKGQRTDKRFKARTDAAAITEFELWKAGGEEVVSKKTIAALIQAYRDANYPGAKMSQKKADDFADGEKSRCDSLEAVFGQMKAAKMEFKHILEYRDERVAKIKKKRCSGLTTVDLDLGTLSNVFKHGLRLGWVKSNPMANRERFAGTPTLSRDKCCRSGDELHDVANALAPALALQFLFECCSGVRTEEALSMKRGAVDGEAGHIRTEDGKRGICIRRVKQGDQDPFDYLLINPALELVLGALDAYHAKLKKPSRWFFPGRNRVKDDVMDECALSHALAKVARKLFKGRRLTSHGCRAFYITWRVCQGADPYQIAREVGHRSGPALIHKHYARRVSAWAGKDFGPYPTTVKAFWHGLSLLAVVKKEESAHNGHTTKFTTSVLPNPAHASNTPAHLKWKSDEPISFLVGHLQHTCTR